MDRWYTYPLSTPWNEKDKHSVDHFGDDDSFIHVQDTSKDIKINAEMNPKMWKLRKFTLTIFRQINVFTKEVTEELHIAQALHCAEKS